MKNAKIYRHPEVKNTNFDIPLVLSVFFYMVNFWKFSCNRRRHWARADLFRSPTSCMWPVIKRETKEKNPPLCIDIFASWCSSTIVTAGFDAMDNWCVGVNTYLSFKPKVLCNHFNLSSCILFCSFCAVLPVCLRTSVKEFVYVEIEIINTEYLWE